MKKAIFFIIIFILIATMAVFTLQYKNQSKSMTFAECEEIGGAVWLVNPYHPDLCPSCSDYYQCNNKYGDIGHYCQEQIGPEWSKNELYKKCVDDILDELEKACPEVTIQCANCIKTIEMYPDKCPDGMKKIAEISDSETQR